LSLEKGKKFKTHAAGQPGRGHLANTLQTERAGRLKPYNYLIAASYI